jgi:hypothetical protein
VELMVLVNVVEHYVREIVQSPVVSFCCLNLAESSDRFDVPFSVSDSSAVEWFHVEWAFEIVELVVPVTVQMCKYFREQE